MWSYIQLNRVKSKSMCYPKRKHRVTEIIEKTSAGDFDQAQNDSIKMDNQTKRDTDENSAPVFVEKHTTKRTSLKKMKKELEYESEGYKKKTFAHRMKTLAILVSLAIFTGCGLGVWYYNTMLKSNMDWDTLFAQADTYMPDYNKTFADNFSISNVVDKSWVQSAHLQGKTPDKVSAIDNFVLADFNATHSSTFSSISHGKVVTLGINQVVYSEKLFDGNAYSFSGISNGVVTVMNLDYHQKNSPKVLNYTGKKNGESISWSQSGEMTYDAYKDYVGVPLSQTHPYIVSTKTVKEASEVTYDEMSGNYNFTLVLDNVLGAINYTKQVRKNGGLGSYPEFTNITLTVTIDSNWNFISIQAKEYYSAIAYGMKVGCDSSLTYDYTFDSEIILPV